MSFISLLRHWDLISWDYKKSSQVFLFVFLGNFFQLSQRLINFQMFTDNFHDKISFLKGSKQGSHKTIDVWHIFRSNSGSMGVWRWFDCVANLIRKHSKDECGLNPQIFGFHLLTATFVLSTRISDGIYSWLIKFLNKYRDTSDILEVNSIPAAFGK